MLVSLLLLALSLAGALGGAWLVGMWAVGLVLLAYSVGLGVFAVLRDIPEPVAKAQMTTLEAVLDRARRSA